MLLDNKTKITDDEPYKVFEFIKTHTDDGNLDIVTGYFSVNALAHMFEELNSVSKFRLILGNLMQEEFEESKIINLLNGNTNINGTLGVSMSAKKAVQFLQQHKVFVRNIQKNFCHAKTYLYTDKTKTKNYFIVGSSNLTDAGLGLKESSNIELNIAKHDYEDEFKNLTKWFKKQWEDVAQDIIEVPNKPKIFVKQYLIELIQNLYKQYSPSDLYYKVLYELFKDEILEISKDTEFKRGIAHLEQTIIYQSLYPYQQKGALSLIKMLQKYNGAILADAVGLGKTWTALSVMKYFELKGYTVLLLCPKKLSNNWQQYLAGNQSRFEKDEMDFYIRYHTDLQEGRFDRYTDKSLHYFKTRNKLLIVIDESHNLRNDKSSRFKFLVDNLLQNYKKRDIKMLHLSATPINNKLIDIRNQFKLMVGGNDEGFKETDLEVESLESTFRTAQKDFNEWAKKQNKSIEDFVSTLPKKFEKLTDSLIVARTRKLIEDEFGKMNFPEKEPPINEYVTTENIGNLKSFNDVIDAISINFTAYRPASYMESQKPISVLYDEEKRQTYLAKMMYKLLIKRLESNWYAFKITIENVLHQHQNALDKVNQFLLDQDKNLQIEETFTDEVLEELDETAAEYDGPDEEEEKFTLGKKNPIPIAEIVSIDKFKKDLENDIAKLTFLKNNLNKFENDFNNNIAQDQKLEALIGHIRNKLKQTNKKVLIFTAFKDTSQFLYQHLQKKGIKKIAYVSGSVSETDDGYKSTKFEPILERFAPYTKLYKEKDWSEMYQNHFGLNSPYYKNEKWNVPFEEWKKLIATYDKQTLKKLLNPIDVLIATDCLSEGQNLQDCDMVINYDIHWNPVRIIQRMGRIDRIGSPNKTIKGINFWPAKDFEDFLNLKSRVENRMAVMTLAGTEIDPKMTPELEKIVQDNPLLPKQAEKMLAQLQVKFEDVEVNDQTLGLNDLSLEQFRQDLLELFRKNEEFFKKMPDGVFTGFKWKFNKKSHNTPDTIIAALGYPKRPDGAIKHVYQEIYLIHQTTDGKQNQSILCHNHHEILNLIRNHRKENRYVPKEIEEADPTTIQKLTQVIHQWIQAQAQPVAAQEIQNLFEGNANPQKIKSDQFVEEKFNPENFDLIAWFILTNELI